jgi:MFS family permease
MAAMALTVLPLPFVPGLALMAAALFVSGLAIAPTMVAAMTLVEQIVPTTRLTEGIAWVTTGLAAGLAPGAAVAGGVVDAWGTSAGYGVPVVAGLLGAAVGLVGSRPPKPASEPANPAAAGARGRGDLAGT